MTYVPKKKRITNAQIIDDIRKFYKKNGRAPYCYEYKYNGIARTRFGTWNNAITKAIGKEHVYTHRVYNRNKLIKDYRSLSERLGHSASVNEIEADKRIPSWNTYKREFKSIITLADEANLSEDVIDRWQDNTLKNWTADQLLSGYFELEKKLGRIPLGRDINGSDDLPSTNVYARVFGSLTAMREKYNLPKPSAGGQRIIPKKELVIKVAKFYKVNGRFPVKHEFKPNGISRSSLLRRFNTASQETVWKEIVNDPYFKKIIENNTL